MAVATMRIGANGVPVPLAQKPQGTVHITPVMLKAKRFIVTHDAVDRFPKDTIVSADDLKGIDVERLLRLGAIEALVDVETDSPKA